MSPPAAASSTGQRLLRIGANWTLRADPQPAYAGPTLIVTGRLDSTVGVAAVIDLVNHAG